MIYWRVQLQLDRERDISCAHAAHLELGPTDQSHHIGFGERGGQVAAFVSGQAFRMRASRSW